MIALLEQGADVATALKQSFLKTHEDLVRHCDETGEFDVALSGTTATCMVHDTVNNKL